MLNKKPTLIIMAAGMGSRYGGSKQVDKMTDAGEIILDFSLYDAMLAGFNRVVFIIREEHRDIFREHAIYQHVKSKRQTKCHAHNGSMRSHVESRRYFYKTYFMEPITDSRDQKYNISSHPWRIYVVQKSAYQDM